jgi:hypothetical protein
MNVAEVDKVTGKFNIQFKHKLFVKPFEEWMSQVTPSSEGTRLMAFSQRTPDSRKI